MSEYRQLAKNTVWAALGSLSSKFIIFFMVPLYTHILSRSQYGLIDFLQLSTYMFGIFFSLQMMEAVFRYSNGQETDEQRAIFTNGVCIILFALFVFVLSAPFLKYFGSYNQYLPYFIIMVILNVFLEYIKAFTRAQTLMRALAAGDILYTIFFTSLNIYLMVVLKMAIVGFMLSLIGAQLFAILFLSIVCKAHRYILPSAVTWKHCRKMLLFSLPLIPSSISGFFIAYIDRFLLISLMGLAAAGLYTLANKVLTILLMFSMIFNQSWMISGLKQYENSALSVNEKETFYTRVFEYNASMLMLIISMLLLILKPGFHFTIDLRFNEAWIYVPALLMGGLFCALTNYVSVIYIAEQKTKKLLYINAGGAIVNILLNLLLIPVIGIQGASIATAVAYLFLFSWIFIDSAKFLKITIKPKSLLSFILLISQTICLYENLVLLQIVIFFIIYITNKELLVSAFNYGLSVFQNRFLKKPSETEKLLGKAML